MKIAKLVLIFFSPMFLLYLLNILIFNKYPMFFPCFCGSCIYIYSIGKIKSCEKLIYNFLNKDKKELYNEDFRNLVLIFSLTFLVVFLIYIMEIKIFMENIEELGSPFGWTAIIFFLMSCFKFPKRFYC